MFKLVLASHGKLADGMKDSVQLIVGRSAEIYTICAYVDETVKLENQIEDLFEKFDDSDEVIVVTDIFGGSVNNEFMNRLQKGKFWLIAGMNLSLVIELTLLDSSVDLRAKLLDTIGKCGKEMYFCNALIEGLRDEKEEF